MIFERQLYLWLPLLVELCGQQSLVNLLFCEGELTNLTFGLLYSMEWYLFVKDPLESANPSFGVSSTLTGQSCGSTCVTGI